VKTSMSSALRIGRQSNTEYWLVAASGPVLLGAALVGWWLSWLSASTAMFCFLLRATLVAGCSRNRSLRVADLVTLVRGLGVCFLAGLSLQALAGGLAARGVLTMIIMSTLCLTLDGVDGRLARARGEATAFGARFDMETDAAMLAVLSIAVAALGIAGWWVLAIGVMRYGYVAVSTVLPSLRPELPVRYSAKIVAVVQAVALITALTFGLTHSQRWLPTTFLLVALALLCWSFSRDMIVQFRRSL
jgi:phosphatidylglycerophosphate synthase